MDAGVLASPTPDLILQDARLLNSDIGRHSVKCNFSTRLAGRFYQNGSLERHTFRKSRLVEMQARKRRLEKELQLEEQRVKLLEEKLNDTEKAREDAHGLIITMEHGLIQFQTRVRRRQALKLFRRLQHESHMRKLIAQFFQRHYRGWKGRLRSESRRDYLRQKRRDESAAAIQANIRRQIQRKSYLNLLSERERLSNRSAAAIQANVRRKLTRQMYHAELSRRHDAAKNIQRMWRGEMGRMMAGELRQELDQKRIEAEKPKRIPLHLRRYSTYGSNSNAPRKASKTKKRDARMRRRSSDAMIIMNDGRLSSLANLKSTASAGHERDENDSIASTMTSLTNHTNATGTSSKRRTHGTVRRNNHPTFQMPQRVMAPNRRGVTTQQPCNKVIPRRGSLERRKTVCGDLSTQPKKASRGRMQSLPQTCAGPERDQSTAPRERQKISENREKNDNPGDSVAKPTKIPPREGISTPIIFSKEAYLIVQEVLGKSVMSHSIVHSVFEDEVSEHEDDLI
mmetsp:Transcript_21500/g.51956  ORF Transcript_21500/g.51956 Transcript_21500/m.51956 type:complete len:512 (-) Transcript_21500:111-1646(-)